MYRVASKLVEEGWEESPAEVADGLCVFLFTWNKNAYRSGTIVSRDTLEQFLTRNKSALDRFRRKQITSFYPRRDTEKVKQLFNEALDALAYPNERAKKKISKSAVGVGKAFHLLAPSFFPLWDRAIAENCLSLEKKHVLSASDYVEFMKLAQSAVISLEKQLAGDPESTGSPVAQHLPPALSQIADRPKTVLKLLDEYYHTKYPKERI